MKRKSENVNVDWLTLTVWVLVSFGLGFFVDYVGVIATASSFGRLIAVAGILGIGGLLVRQENRFNYKKLFWPGLGVGVVLTLFVTWLIELLGDKVVLWCAYLLTGGIWFVLIYMIRHDKNIGK